MRTLVSLSSGASSAGSSGSVSLSSGASSGGSGGAVSIGVGAGAGAAGGALSVTAGSTSAASGVGGGVSLAGGDGSSGGSIELRWGSWLGDWPEAPRLGGSGGGLCRVYAALAPAKDLNAGEIWEWGARLLAAPDDAAARAPAWSSRPMGWY